MELVWQALNNGIKLHDNSTMYNIKELLWGSLASGMYAVNFEAWYVLLRVTILPTRKAFDP